MNNQLSRNALITYLSDLRTLEFIKYKSEESIRKINDKQFNMEEEVDIAKCNIPKECKEKPSFWGNFFVALFGAAGILFVFGIFSIILILLFWDSLPFILLIAAIFAIIFACCEYKKEKNAYLADQQRFANEKRQYDNNVAYCQTKLDKFKPEAQKRINILEKYIQKIDNILQKNYNLNIVPKQFRDIYGVTYLYDFISTSSLSLSDAVLNYQLDRIKSQLDQIISKCGEIIRNLQKLNLSMYEIQQQNNELLKESKKNSKYSEITATNSAVALELQKKQLAYQEVDFWLNKV